MGFEIKRLDALKIGERARVKDISSTGEERRRMRDLGLTDGAKVEAVTKSPAGDPTAYFVRGAVIALRREDAGKVTVELS